MLIRLGVRPSNEDQSDRLFSRMHPIHRETQESGGERVIRQAAFLELIAYSSPSDAELLAAETKSVTFGQFGQNMSLLKWAQRNAFQAGLPVRLTDAIH